jgi:hypothetical protein
MPRASSRLSGWDESDLPESFRTSDDRITLRRCQEGTLQFLKVIILQPKVSPFRVKDVEMEERWNVGHSDASQVNWEEPPEEEPLRAAIGCPPWAGIDCQVAGNPTTL